MLPKHTFFHFVSNCCHAPQVCDAEATLSGLHITVSAVRVAGVFVVDFAAAEPWLLHLQRQLAAVSRDPCHVGVLGRLEAINRLLQQMRAVVQVSCFPCWFTVQCFCLTRHGSILRLKVGCRAGVWCISAAQVACM